MSVDAMTMVTPNVEANAFHVLGYTTEVTRSLRTAGLNLKIYWYCIRLDSGLKRVLSDARSGDFDPAATEARQACETMLELHERLEFMLAYADRCGVSQHPVHKRLFDSIRPKAEKVGDIAESWQLALQPKFRELVNEARRRLTPQVSSQSQ